MHSRSLIRISVGRMKNLYFASFAFPNASSEDSAQTYLNLCWAHMSEGTFSYLAAQMSYISKITHSGIPGGTVQGHLCTYTPLGVDSFRVYHCL